MASYLKTKPNRGSPPYLKKALMAHSEICDDVTLCKVAKIKQVALAWISPWSWKKALIASASGPLFSTNNCRKWSTGLNFDTIWVP